MARDPGRSAPDSSERGALEHALVGELMRADSSSRPATDHAAPESLIAYRTGALDEEGRAALQAHLGSCAECIQTLRDLDGFLAPAAGQESATTDFEESAGWRRLQSGMREHLAATGGSSSGASPPVSSQHQAPAQRMQKRWSVFATAAAVLAATTGALLVQTQRMESQLALYDRPSADVAVLYVETGDRRAAGADVQHYDVSANAPSFLLMIESPDLPAQGCCEIEIASESGDSVWKGEGRPGQLGALRLSVPRAFLPGGVYWIVVNPTSDEAPVATVTPRAPLLKERIEIRYR